VLASSAIPIANKSRSNGFSDENFQGRTDPSSSGPVIGGIHIDCHALQLNRAWVAEKVRASQLHWEVMNMCERAAFI
jgi:hypothetical protein